MIARSLPGARLSRCIVAGLLSLWSFQAWSSGQIAAIAEQHKGMHGGRCGAAMHMSGDEHAAHRAMMNDTRYTVSNKNYDVPDVELIDKNGNKAQLQAILDTDEPIALNFIFTTCTTICPVMTATFAQMQRQLGEKAGKMRLVSISIDPEYDRPDVLKDYAEKFHAGDNWAFLTGDSKDIINILQSFDSFAGTKMNHRPVTFLKNPGNPEWIRIDGLTSGTNLAQEISTRLFN